MGANNYSYEIEDVSPDHAESICDLLIASIVELCVEDHNNDKNNLSDWLLNKRRIQVISAIC